LDVAAPQLAKQLDVVISRHTVSVPLHNHLHDQTQNTGRIGAAVGKISEKGSFTACWWNETLVWT
jgi:hypothetical protein